LIYNLKTAISFTYYKKYFRIVRKGRGRKMKNNKMRNVISVFIITVMVASIFALPVFSDNYKVDAATKKVKVTFNANGGKIGTKAKITAKIVKGQKIGSKLPAAKKMKRDGYKFVGWYKKANGGSKITAKIKATKKVTYYAKWKRVLSSTEQKLVGVWGNYFDGTQVLKFNADGTYIGYFHFTLGTDMRARGFWSIKNGMLYRVAQWGYQTNKDTAGYIEEWGYTWTPWGEWEPSDYKVRFGIDDGSFKGKEYVDIYKNESNFSKGSQRYIRGRVGSAPW